MTIKNEYIKALNSLKEKRMYFKENKKHPPLSSTYIPEEKIKPLLESVPPVQDFIDAHMKKFTDFWGDENMHEKRMQILQNNPERLNLYLTSRNKNLQEAYRYAYEEHQIALMKRNSSDFKLNEIELHKKVINIPSKTNNNYQQTLIEQRELIRKEVIALAKNKIKK
jgi:hypothetical protein